MMQRSAATVLALVLLVLGGIVGETLAVRTEFHHYARMEDYEEAQFRGLLLSDDGSWRLGLTWDEVLADEIAFFTEMADDGRTILLTGGGDPGKIILYDKERERHESIHSSDELLFTCAQTLGENRWAVGAGPGGEIWRVEGPDAVSLMVETGEEFVWDLLLQDETLWIATGGQGRIYRYDLDGEELELFATLPDKNVFSLAMDEQQRLLAGSSGEGLLYRFDHEARMELLADFDAEEVQHIVPAIDGLIYLAVARTAEDCEEICSSVYRLRLDGGLEKMLISDSAFIGDLLPAPEGGLYVSFGDPGELDRLTDLYQGQVLGAEEGVFYGDLHHDGERLWLLQSKPARLVKIGGRAESGTLTSEVRDLTSRSRGGALRVEGDFPRGTSIEVEARAGQGPDPESGWLPWSVCAEESPGVYRMELEPSRYFQWRITLEGKGDKTPILRRVTSSYLGLNRTPLIGNFSVLRPTAGPFEDGLDLMGRPFTQVLERGVRVQYQLKNGSAPAGDAPAELLKGLRQLHWDWLDPDGDRLAARIEFKRESEEQWQLLEQDWTQNLYTWDGRGLPDGHYRLRVTADDELDNAPHLARSMEVLSEAVRLDTSAPDFDLELDRESEASLRIKGKVSDSGGGIVEVIERKDWEGQWVSLASEDGLMDRPELELDLLLPLPLRDKDEDLILELRAADEMGNWNYFRRELGSDR